MSIDPSIEQLRVSNPEYALIYEYCRGHGVEKLFADVTLARYLLIIATSHIPLVFHRLPNLMNWLCPSHQREQVHLDVSWHR